MKIMKLRMMDGEDNEDDEEDDGDNGGATTTMMMMMMTIITIKMMGQYISRKRLFTKQTRRPFGQWLPQKEGPETQIASKGVPGSNRTSYYISENSLF
jgi:hypothetical protein